MKRSRKKLPAKKILFGLRVVAFISIRRYHAKYKLDTNIKEKERIHFDNDTGCYQADETSCIYFKVHLVYLTEQALKLKHVAKDPKWHLVSTNASKWFLW